MNHEMRERLNTIQKPLKNHIVITVRKKKILNTTTMIRITFLARPMRR